MVETEQRSNTDRRRTERRQTNRRQLDYALEHHQQVDFHDLERRNDVWWKQSMPVRLLIRREIDRVVLKIIHGKSNDWRKILKGRRTSKYDSDWVTTNGWQIATLSLPERRSGKDRRLQVRALNQQN